MKYFIYDESDEELAVISVDSGGSYNIEFKDKQFESFLNSKISEGIEVFDEKHEENVHLATTKVISKDDDRGGYAILDFLGYNGYRVSKDAESIKKEIETILAAFPEDDLRKELMETLPSLNYLEATFLLGELKSKK